MKFLYGVFVTIGGVSFLLHMGIKRLAPQIKGILLWIMHKYPALRKFAADHGPDLIAVAQAIEQGEEEAITEAKQ